MLKLTGHSGQILGLAFSDDGRWLASAGHDGVVMIWDLRCFRPVRQIRTPHDYAKCVAFSSDSKHFAVGFANRNRVRSPSDYGTLAFAAIEGEPNSDPDYLHPQDTWHALGTESGSIALHPNGELLASCDGSHFELWNVPTRRPLPAYTFPTKVSFVHDVKYSANGTLAVVGSRKSAELSQRIVYRSESGYSPAGFVLTLHADDRLFRRIDGDVPLRVVFDSQGTMYVGFASGAIMWWRSIDVGRPEIAKLRGRAIRSMAISPDDRTVFLASDDGLVRAWDVTRRTIVQEFDWEIGTVCAVACSPDGTTAAAGGDGVVLIWDVEG
jgi:WD40 repeat protein